MGTVVSGLRLRQCAGGCLGVGVGVGVRLRMVAAAADKRLAEEGEA